MWSPYVLFALRVVFGLVFVIHGLPKLKNLKQTQENFDSMGFHPGYLWGTFIALLETIGGLAIILGVLIQPIALLFAFEMLVTTIWKIRQGKGFVNGYEFDLLLLVVSLTLIAFTGIYSLWSLL
jgi:putative oxidoreductase